MNCLITVECKLEEELTAHEAFFPLIAVAVIYFVLAAILTFLVNKVEVRIDPRKRSRKQLLKGVKADD